MGPDMAIGNGVMLAHAKPNEGVNELGVNFTLFKHPFNLAESGKLINLVIGLAPYSISTPTLNFRDSFKVHSKQGLD